MNDYINDLFDAQTDKEDFLNLDKIITEETNKRLKEYQTKLSQMDYEKIRDVTFSISAIAKKEAFSIGFKTAMRLVLECRDDR